ncbi:MAG: hypothetical protein MJA29_01590, partial [Candidatus Omnitrophica bacterium]|nr:hypothetical protein [Candidatus Omnitrophota bacterium]
VTWESKPAYAPESVVSELFLEGEEMWREFPGLERYVQAWVEGENFGLALENHLDGVNEELYMRFRSVDFSDRQFRPRLDVTVTPEPLSCVLFGVGGLVLAAARRLRR